MSPFFKVYKKCKSVYKQIKKIASQMKKYNPIGGESAKPL